LGSTAATANAYRAVRRRRLLSNRDKFYNRLVGEI
jgi:hypothetical protein